MIKDNKFIKEPVVKIIWTPTVPQCGLALTIGLCIRYKNIKITKRVKLQREFSFPNAKIDIIVKDGTHNNKKESTFSYKIINLVDKQVNDKERIAAALENENILEVIEELIKINEY